MFLFMPNYVLGKVKNYIALFLTVQATDINEALGEGGGEVGVHPP